MSQTATTKETSTIKTLEIDVVKSVLQLTCISSFSFQIPDCKSGEVQKSNVTDFVAKIREKKLVVSNLYNS